VFHPRGVARDDAASVLFPFMLASVARAPRAYPSRSQRAPTSVRSKTNLTDRAQSVEARSRLGENTREPKLCDPLKAVYG
jgi:hypothetical protein